MTNLDSILKSRDIILPIKVHLSKLWFSSSHIWMWDFDIKKNLSTKEWCFWTEVLEKTIESLLDCKEIQPVHSKGDPSWVFIGWLMLKLKLPIVWPPDTESWLIWKTLMLGKVEGRQRSGWQDEMVGWHHWHNGHGFVWTPGVGDGQGGLACCSSWGHKELDTTDRLTWTD